MHPMRRMVLSRLLIGAVSVVPLVTCQAQDPIHVTADAGSVRDSAAPPISAWMSAGFGPGEMPSNTNGVIALQLRGSASAGPWLASCRFTDIGPFLASGNGISDLAFLAGVRSSGHRLFASGELGYSLTSPYYSTSMEAGGRPITQGNQGALAFDAALHAATPLAGLALTLSGATGPARSTYTMMSLSVELGWFGR